MGAGFAVLSMAGYLLWRRQKHHHAGWYIASWFCFLLAATANASVILLPAIMVMWDFVVEKRARWAVLFEKLPFAAVVMLVHWMTLHVQTAPQHSANLGTFAATELANLTRLVSFDPPALTPAADGPEMPAALAFSLVILAIAAWVLPLILFARNQPIRLALAWWILVGFVMPAMVIGNPSGPTLDRQLFLASVAACVLLADLLAALATSFRGAWALALAALIALASFWTFETSRHIDKWLSKATDASLQSPVLPPSSDH